jgi:23S rRNA (guanosine2251-2'-O)-methyltransferase
MTQKIFGRNAVLETLRRASGIQGRLYLARHDQDASSGEAEGLAEGCGLTIEHVPRERLDQLSGGGRHQGILLMLEASVSTDTQDWSDILATAIEAGRYPRVALLDRIQDPGNLGAILRSAALFGIDVVFIPKDRSVGMTPAVRKAACGGDLLVRVETVSNLIRIAEQLKKMGFWLAAAVADGETTLWDARFDCPIAVVMGSEGEGVRRLLLEACDYRISIPTTGRLDSLNVSVASALIFHEMFRYDRQHGTQPRA